MKIGILTFHDVFNPGAFLQALGTQTLVERMGHEAQVIDYTGPVHRFQAFSYFKRWNWRMLYRFRTWYGMLLKERAFERARVLLLKRTRFYETRDEVGEVHFDAVLVGADVVWNFKHAYLGRDPVYFGAGLNTQRLISFAASCGDCSLSDEVPEYVQHGLSNFNSYSVRDQNTAEMVREYAKQDALQICDPAFHLDLEAIMPEPAQRDPFLLVYLRNGAFAPELKDQIMGFARNKGLRVVATYYTHSWTDENLLELEPQDWLGLIRDAAYVVTNTFHGSVFSIMLEKQFALDYNDGIRLKTVGMIEAMELKGRVLESPGGLSEVLESEVDFGAARDFRARETAKASAFLQQALA